MSIQQLFDRVSFTEKRTEEYAGQFATMSDEDFIAEVLGGTAAWAGDRCVGEKEHADADAEYAAMKAELLKRFGR